MKLHTYVSRLVRGPVLFGLLVAGVVACGGEATQMNTKSTLPPRYAYTLDDRTGQYVSDRYSNTVPYVKITIHPENIQECMELENLYAISFKEMMYRNLAGIIASSKLPADIHSLGMTVEDESGKIIHRSGHEILVFSQEKDAVRGLAESIVKGICIPNVPEQQPDSRLAYGAKTT